MAKPTLGASNLAQALDSANDDRSVTAEASDGANTPGMTSLIERMHGVTRREDAPVRKRKSEVNGDDGNDEDGSKKKVKTTFQGTANGGIVSHHMKAEREKIVGDAGPPDTLIDLTNGDDADEVQFVKERVNDEVCMGIFHDKVHLHRQPSVSSKSMGVVGQDHWPPTKLTYQREVSGNKIINLYDAKGNHVATFPHQLGNALCPLLDAKPLKFKLKVMLAQRQRKAHDAPGKHVSEYHKVMIFTYARSANSLGIGTHLSRHGIFLSAPPANPGAEYYNPQLPKPLGQAARNGERRPQTGQNNVTRTAEEMRRDADSMFADLFKQEDLVEMEPNPDYISTPLLTHQKQALHFLTQHEKGNVDGESKDDPNVPLWKHNVRKDGREYWYNVITGHETFQKPTLPRGGLLADMMGLGKTLSILSLLAQTMNEAKIFGRQEPSPELAVERNLKGTLIICPKSVMSNWEEQVRAHAQGKFTIYCYHGPNRTRDPQKLAKYDIVLTTYQTVASDFNIKDDRAIFTAQWFRIVLDEAHQIRNKSTGVSKACCALLAQRRWAVTGTPVQNGLDDLGALVKFLRIRPFDEGSSWAQYIMAPFKNSDVTVLEHLQLLVHSITLRRLKDTIDLCKRREEITRLQFTPEERRIYEKVAGEVRMKFDTMSGGTNKLRGKSYAHILKSIGQMRAICAHNLDMLHEEERKEILEGINPDNAIALDIGDEPGDEPDDKFITENQAYRTLDMMRDSEMSHCSKCARKIGEKETADGAVVDLTDDDEGDEEDSSSDDANEQDNDTIGYLTPCYHLLCPKCKDVHIAAVTPDLTADKRHNCQICNMYVRFGLFELTRSKYQDFVTARHAANKGPKGRKWDETTYSGPSTKVNALVNDLEQSAQETALLPEGEPPIRSVVFSGWTTFLDLIEVALDEHAIGYVRLDGSMSIRARRNVLSTFASDPCITVLLVSIKAGGQGLNLTAANKVYMMEPQFNPGVEQQAIDRVHRLGQKRDVEIRHFIMVGSVEEGILRLQEKKEKLAKLSMERRAPGKGEEAKQRLEDLKGLFK